jgi:hypothetical protein
MAVPGAERRARSKTLAVRAFGNQYAAVLATAYGGVPNANQVIRPLRFSGTVSRSQKPMLPRNAFIRSHLMDLNWMGI